MEQQYTRITTSLFEAIQKVTTGGSEQKQEVLSEKVESINKQTESIDEAKKPWSPEPATRPPNPKDAEHKKASMLIDKIRSLRQLGVEAKEKGDHDKHKEYHERAKQADQEYQKLGHKSLMSSPLRSEGVDEAMTPEFEKKFAETPKGVEVHMKHKETGKIIKNKFIGTHSAVAAAKKHIADMEKKGYEVHAKKLIEQEEQTDEAVTDYNPKSQGGTRKELLAKYAETGNSKHAEAARKAGASHEELKNAQMTAMKRGVGKKGSNYLLSKNEELEQTDEGAMSDLDADRKDRAYQTRQARTTMKHIANPTPGEKKAAKDIKPGIAGYRDRIAMLKSAEARGGLKKEEVEQESENQVDEARFKKGQDVGAPGMNFAKIAKSAAARYGSKEAGQRVAGAVLKKVMAKEEEEQFDETIIKEDLNIEAPEQFTFKDYLTAVTSLVGSELEEHQIVAVAYEAFRTQEEDIILEELTRDDLKQKMKAHMDAGHQISGEKFSMKDGKPYGEYVVTDKETGVRRKYIHHGSTRRVENMGSRTKKDAKAND